MKLPKIEWPTAAVLIALIAAIVAVWVTGPEHRGDILAGLGVCGGAVLALMRALISTGVAPSEPAQTPRPPRSSSRHTIAPRVALVLGSVVVVGCAPSALRTHSTIATIARVSVVAAHPAIVSACEARMSECHDDGCLEDVRHDCEAAAIARDTAHAAVRAYVDAIEVAAHADEGRVAEALDASLAGLARVYEETRRVVLALTGYALPELPPEALAIVRALVGAARD